MQNKIKAPRSVVIAVLTVITVLFWIGFEVFRIFTAKPAPSIPREVLLPLSPSLDSNTLSGLQQRVYLEDSEIGNTIIEGKAINTPQPSSTPTPVQTEGPIATPVGTGSPTPIATSTPGPTATP